MKDENSNHGRMCSLDCVGVWYFYEEGGRTASQESAL